MELTCVLQNTSLMNPVESTMNPSYFDTCAWFIMGKFSFNRDELKQSHLIPWHNGVHSVKALVAEVGLSWSCSSCFTNDYILCAIFVGRD